jgi:hypothetical protein
MESTPAPKTAPPKATTPAARNTAAGEAVSARRPATDWEAVERDYRASQMTLRELAAKHGCSHGRIAQRAKAEGWSRDLLPAIKQATDKRLIEAAVNSTLTSEANRATQGLTNAVLIAAEVNTQVILGHRKGLNRITRIKETLLDQIEQAALLMPDLAEVIEMVRQPDDNGIDKANDALRKAMGRSGLVDDLKKLAEIDERVRKGEREAFNIAGPADGDDGQPKRKRVTLDFIDVVAK